MTSRIELEPLSRVCLAISSFQNDESIRRILESVHARQATPFCRVIVVDSLGTGEIPRLIESRGWQEVDYYDADRNLGSAGNLARRLELAAETDADYVYTVNHDGHVDPESVARLVDRAEQYDEQLGAAYPVRFCVNRDAYDQTGVVSLPIPFVGGDDPPDQEVTEVVWSSSNGALYALEPVRAGHMPDEDLWMGWEDMGYGWRLERHGYTQILVNDVEFADDYEYEQHDLLGYSLHLTDKPVWYSYYQFRNLLLIADNNDRSILTYAVIGGRLLGELALTVMFRSATRKRLDLLFRGVVDGLRNKKGKGSVP